MGGAPSVSLALVPAIRAAARGGSNRAPSQAAITYRPGSLAAALALAGDLGLPQKSVVKTGDSPRKVMITTGR